MNWDRSALVTVDILGCALVGRLLSLRLQRVYKVFCAYLSFNLLGSTVALAFIAAPVRDYKVLFIVAAVGTWAFTLWMVYALLEAILAQLTGILQFSRRLLVGVSVLATIVAIASVKADYSALHAVLVHRSLDSLVQLAIVIERIVTILSLSSLLAIQAFVLWFPVSMPRNLMFFSIGFVFNFICETALLLASDASPNFKERYLSPLNLFQLGACFAYWATVITKEGEVAPVTVGHTWDPLKQQQLFETLASMNSAMLPSSPSGDGR